MDFKSVCEGITFNQVQPKQPSYMLEVANTDLHFAINAGLVDLCAIPKMSTFALGCVINEAVKQMPIEQSFVNVGVWHGFTLLAGMVNNPDKKCIGIDNFSEFGGPRNEFRQRFMAAKSVNHSFYDMDYRTYFSEFHKGQIGFYIYDGSHDYNNQLEGLRVAEPYFADDCLIMIDDINWPDPERATLDFIAGSKYNYEIIFKEKTSANCHPTFWNGVMAIKKGSKKELEDSKYD